MNGQRKCGEVCTMECSSAIKSEILSFAATWMGPEDRMLTEINKAHKDKYHMFSLILES
jgi:hypothetical protein